MKIIDRKGVERLTAYLNKHIKLVKTKKSGLGVRVVGCDNKLTRASKWMKKSGYDVDKSCALLAANGGFCDCEVIFNVRSDKLHIPNNKDGRAYYAYKGITPPSDIAIAALKNNLKADPRSAVLLSVLGVNTSKDITEADIKSAAKGARAIRSMLISIENSLDAVASDMTPGSMESIFGFLNSPIPKRNIKKFMELFFLSMMGK